MNPFDELAVEEAVRLRERAAKATAGTAPPPAIAEILAFSAGPAKAADVLRTAMAMGADRSVHVQVSEEEAPAGLEPLTVAKLLAAVAREQKSDMVIMGKQSIDDDASQTGPILAGLLSWPQATQASNVNVKALEAGGHEATVEKEVDGGTETVKAKLPMVVTADLRLNEPRYASLPNIMKAKKKPMEKKTLADYGVELRQRMQTVKVEEPEQRKGGGKVEDVDGMIGRLKELGAL